MLLNRLEKKRTVVMDNPDEGDPAVTMNIDEKEEEEENYDRHDEEEKYKNLKNFKLWACMNL